MRKKLRTDRGRETYMKRQGIAEPLHGDDQKNRGWRQHHLRGLLRARGEFLLIRIATNLGKIVRLNDDGSVPADNPFAERGGVAAQVWSLGHRNPLGLAFDAQGRLWEHEMGPRHGDELNLIERGRNYGYPIVSNGDHYDGRSIPDHDTRPEFAAPKAYWVPAISPAGLIIYSGAKCPAWRGSALLGGLSSTALVRVQLDGETAREVERWDMNQRIREIEQGPDGDVWILEDGNGGRLLRLSPR
jgi:glucose/arabinose dehydrogenase